MRKGRQIKSGDPRKEFRIQRVCVGRAGQRPKESAQLEKQLCGNRHFPSYLNTCPCFCPRPGSSLKTPDWFTFYVSPYLLWLHPPLGLLRKKKKKRQNDDNNNNNKTTTKSCLWIKVKNILYTRPVARVEHIWK